MVCKSFTFSQRSEQMHSEIEERKKFCELTICSMQIMIAFKSLSFHLVLSLAFAAYKSEAKRVSSCPQTSVAQ